MKKVFKILKKFTIVIFIIIFYLSFILLLSCNWAVNKFSFSNFDEIIFTITSPVLNAGNGIVWDFVKSNIILPTFILILIILLIIFYKRYDIEIYFRIFKYNFVINFRNKILKNVMYISFIFFSLSFTLYSFNKFGKDLYFFDYIKMLKQNSKFIENNYVYPNDVELKFPEYKRNLIYIYLESMENTFSSKDVGGFYDFNYIPNLSKIARNNMYFSNSDKLGGALAVGGTTWTMAAMIAQTSGIPLKTPFNGNLLGSYYKEIVPGAVSLGEILSVNGYNNYLMVGSDASFASRDLYFSKHGNYKIYDYYTAIEDGIIDSDYYVFWGFEDKILFEYAKQELSKISKNDEPFNFTLLTVDTHAQDGYMDNDCPVISDNLYLNSVYCSDKNVANFINWLQRQSFYKNTTVIITGDHLSMNNYSFDEVTSNGYTRTIYNAFLNSPIKPITSSNRIFTTLDMFPTTLAALNVKIDGERLGLGTNLFSKENTITEEYGLDNVYLELNKFSDFYSRCIMDKCN